MGLTKGEITIMLIFSVLILYFLFAVWFVRIFQPFRHERRMLLYELGRAESKEGRTYWKKRLRRLYLSMLPFYDSYRRFKDRY